MSRQDRRISTGRALVLLAIVALALGTFCVGLYVLVISRLGGAS